MAHRLFVVSGPAGAGKGTILARVRERRPGLAYSVSATTRPPRAGEKEGVSYYFMDVPSFRAHVDAGDFLEWADVHGNLYGTLLSEVRDRLREGSLVLEIDPQGAARVRELMPGCVTLFIAPPDMETLRERLVKRGSETPETLATRLSDARGEMEQAPLYDHVVVNDDLGRAVDEVLALMDASEAEEPREARA